MPFVKRPIYSMRGSSHQLWEFDQLKIWPGRIPPSISYLWCRVGRNKVVRLVGVSQRIAHKPKGNMNCHNVRLWRCIMMTPAGMGLHPGSAAANGEHQIHLKAFVCERAIVWAFLRVYKLFLVRTKQPPLGAYDPTSSSWSLTVYFCSYSLVRCPFLVLDVYFNSLSSVTAH